VLQFQLSLNVCHSSPSSSNEDLADCWTLEFDVPVPCAPQVFAALDASTTLRPLIRLSYDAPNSELIVRLVPTALHEVAHTWLAQEIIAQLNHATNHKAGLVNLGSMRMTFDQGSKEGDSSITTADRLAKRRHGKQQAWPTFVIEAGFAKSRRELHVDACRWLSTSDSEVNMIFLVSVTGDRANDPEPNVLIEQWAMVPIEGPFDRRNSTVRTRMSPCHLADQDWEDGDGELQIELCYLFDEVPAEVDAAFSTGMMVIFAETMDEYLRHIKLVWLQFCATGA